MLSFLAVIFLVFVLGFEAINQVKSLADLSRQMYQHPFIVSNAALEANEEIHEIRQHLLEIILTKSAAELEISIPHINQHEAKVYKQLETVKANFLGDPSQIEELIKSFEVWKPVRSEIIDLVRAGRHEDARLMVMEQAEGGKHFARLTGQMDDLIAVARAKADEFVSKGQDARNRSLAVLLVMIVAIILVTMVIFVITAKKVNEAARHLNQAQKMETVGLLTGGIAHDFNNILGIVLGTLELLQRRVAGDPGMSAQIQKAIHGTQRGVSITRKLLGFSRQDAGAVKLTKVNAFIDSLRELIARSLTPSIKVEQNLTADLWPVEINPGDFEDVILNLALNARDAMPDGGTLVIETANKILDEAYARRNPSARAGEFVMVSLSDTGAGMTDEVREKIFEPFFTTKEQGKGTGLGLSMVYGFVQRSGGHIIVYSEVGEGTSFHLYLPRAREKASGDEEPVDIPDGPPSRGSECILVVDDEQDLVDLAATILESLGYKTFCASDGEQALKLLEDHEEIDLMFSDVIMPGRLDGYKLALAARKISPALKILLTSGFTKKREESLRGESAVAELTGNLLSKPYTLSELAAGIRRTLDQERGDDT